jgi:hypothetical protein
MRRLAAFFVGDPPDSKWLGLRCRAGDALHLAACRAGGGTLRATGLRPASGWAREKLVGLPTSFAVRDRPQSVAPEKARKAPLSVLSTLRTLAHRRAAGGGHCRGEAGDADRVFRRRDEPARRAFGPHRPQRPASIHLRRLRPSLRRKGRPAGSVRCTGWRVRCSGVFGSRLSSPIMVRANAVSRERERSSPPIPRGAGARCGGFNA